MRENMGLYRGKRLGNGEWAYGYYVKSEYYFDGKCRHFIVGDNGRYDDDGLYPMHVVDRYTVGEYTGLTDKNGKRIFEGDVVATATGKPHEVMFANGEFLMDGTAIPFKFACKFEVIGNIHDNPGLKGEE